MALLGVSSSNELPLERLQIYARRNTPHTRIQEHDLQWHTHAQEEFLPASRFEAAVPGLPVRY